MHIMLENIMLLNDRFDHTNYVLILLSCPWSYQMENLESSWKTSGKVMEF